LELQQVVDIANDPPINICRLTGIKVQIRSEGKVFGGGLFFATLSQKICRFHATLARFVV